MGLAIQITKDSVMNLDSIYVGFVGERIAILSTNPIPSINDNNELPP